MMLGSGNPLRTRKFQGNFRCASIYMKGMTMRNIALTMACAGGIIGAFVAAAPAVAAPTGPGTAQDTINTLEANGHKVIVNKVGSASLDQCTVSAVRPGRDVTEFRNTRSDRMVERVLYTTVYVDLQC